MHMIRIFELGLRLAKAGTALTCPQPRRFQNPGGPWAVVQGAKTFWGSIRPGIPGADEPAAARR